MNQETKDYWQTFVARKKLPTSTAVTAWQFGSAPDELAQLVIAGIKTATCSAAIFYELENEPYPRIDEYSIILNRQDLPVAIIQTTDVTQLPMNQVPAAFAIAEGEGDCSYDYWYQVHRDFFTAALKEIDQSFSEDLLLVCERFKVVDTK
ncbi:ASCH domain-containing protein [Isobaculum melis]|uniref:Uncharacterized protein YhfF n=1 Tax=Isobaculum melis TaxID=142588 RepID=A0A1H9SPH8_9LACT|nr:ASCH domain-containing protein [Isobaculum melis]SER86866.1 Uncharacterized protein YhfF [Isobaculum melis]